ISLAQVDHNEIGSCGIDMVLDKVSSNLNGDYENIVIANNAISYQRETNRRKSRQGYEMSATTSAIGLAPGGVVRNVLVAGNIIRNAPVKGIALGFSNDSICKNLVIKDNLIVDAGLNAGVEQRGHRASIFLVGHLADVAVEGNTIIDTGRPLNGYQSFYVYPTSATRVSIQDNNIGTKQGNLYDNRDRSKASGPGNRF
ncbi:MAG TPA: hypothetical protein VKP69_32140, partial [Isosphaeraceae bacterium]|nr:hypothetical protein [Isosphaeraceae bacterium]